MSELGKAPFPIFCYTCSAILLPRLRSHRHIVALNAQLRNPMSVPKISHRLPPLFPKQATLILQHVESLPKQAALIQHTNRKVQHLQHKAYYYKIDFPFLGSHSTVKPSTHAVTTGLALERCIMCIKRIKFARKQSFNDCFSER